MTKFDDLKKRYSEGTLTEDWLESEGIEPTDFTKVRNDMLDVENMSLSERYGEHEEGSRKFNYVFVTESPIGYFRDVPLADSWSFKDFMARKAPVFYHHDSYAGPVGRASSVKKNQEYKNLLAVTGGVTFAPNGLSKIADFAFGMVEAKMINGGSVGFQVEKMRDPTEEDKSKFKLGKWSSIFEKCSLTEFSVLGVGRDPLAGVVYSADGQSEFEKFIAENPDRFDEDVVREFREYQYTGEWVAPKKIMVQVDKSSVSFSELETALQTFGLDADGAAEVAKIASSRMEENQVRVVTNREWAEITERLSALESSDSSEESDDVEEYGDADEQYLPEDLMDMSIEDLEKLNLEVAQCDGE